jgi:hypothetical protein
VSNPASSPAKIAFVLLTAVVDLMDCARQGNQITRVLSESEGFRRLWCLLSSADVLAAPE